MHFCFVSTPKKTLNLQDSHESCHERAEINFQLVENPIRTATSNSSPRQQDHVNTGNYVCLFFYIFPQRECVISLWRLIKYYWISTCDSLLHACVCLQTSQTASLKSKPAKLERHSLMFFPHHSHGRFPSHYCPHRPKLYNLCS